MAEATRGEFDAWGQTELGMAGELGVGLAVMEEVLCGKRALKSSENVLGGNAVALQSVRYWKALCDADLPASSNTMG